MTQSKIKTLIVDDERLGIDALKVLLSEDADVIICGEAQSGKDAASFLTLGGIDLVFLDIQMPEVTGFDVIKDIGLHKMPVTVFVTAYDRHALRAFQSRALDYVLKPIDPERFADALKRAKEEVRRRRAAELGEQILDNFSNIAGLLGRKVKLFPDRIAIKTTNGIRLVTSNDIEWIEARGDYVRVIANGNPHVYRETMRSLESKLDPERFLRIHRSTIVNVDQIRDIQPLCNGESVITLHNGIRLKVSRGRREHLQNFIDTTL